MISQEFPLYQITPEVNMTGNMLNSRSMNLKQKGNKRPTPISKFVNSDHMKERNHRRGNSILKRYAKMPSTNSISAIEPELVLRR